MAALDGIQTKIRPPATRSTRTSTTSSPRNSTKVPTHPALARDSLDALRDDHEFLLRGDVFTPDVIDTWIWYKRTPEIEAVRVRPHPYEFTLYYDV